MKRLIALVLAGLMSACATSTTRIHHDNFASAAEKNDRALVTLKDGQQFSLTVTSVSDSALFGFTSSKRYKIPLEGIQRMSVTKTESNTGAVILLTVGVAAAVFLAADIVEGFKTMGHD